MFGLKAFFLPLLEPLGAIWLLMVIGTLWAAWRKQWSCVRWLGLAALLIFLAGSPPLTEIIVSAAEKRYVPRGQWQASDSPWAGADAIVVLGGGYKLSEHDTLGFAVSSGGSRILAGLELARGLKPKALVLGGSVPIPGKPGVLTTAPVANWVQQMAGDGLVVTNLGFCADTHVEALRFKNMKEQSGWRKTILVTSALHMRRSEAVFRKAGVEVIPFACDFQRYGTPARLFGMSLFPTEDRLRILSLYVHEQVGWFMYRWRDWI